MFKRKLNKEIEKEIPTYDEFMEKNEERFKEAGIVIPKTEKHKTTMTRLRLATSIASLCLIIVLSAVLFPFLTRKPQGTFSENDLRMSVCEDKAYYESNYKVFALLSDYDIQKFVYTKSGKDVWLVCDGEYETENNYYIITVNVRLDKRYKFINQPLYDNLEKTITVNEDVYYYNGYLADDGMYDYNIKYSENGNELYLSVWCLNEDITELFEAISTSQLDEGNMAKQFHGKFISLQEAYDRGNISHEDLQKMANYINDSKTRKIDELASDLLNTIIKAYAKLYEADINNINVSYFGAYHSCIAVQLWLKGSGFAQVETVRYVENIDFRYSCAEPEIVIWINNL